MKTQALDDTELDELSDFLSEIAGSAMNLEELDGFFAALICCPDMVMPSEYLPEILGEDYAFADAAQAGRILELVMRHWNAVSEALHRTLKTELKTEDVYLPVLLETQDGIAPGNDWAKGFMRGIAIRPGAWMDLLDNEEQLASLAPIITLAHEHDPDPKMRSKPIAPEKRAEFLAAMILGLTFVYRYFDLHRQAMARTLSSERAATFRRAAPKVGRNDPCLCGSGKKYKRCCAAPTRH